MNDSVQDTIKLLPDYFVTTHPVLETEDLLILVQKLLIAILIGALIGLEREHSKQKDEKIFAGIRTFPLISIAGFVAALISSFTTEWIYLGVFLAFASLVTASHIFSAREGKRGGTSELAALVVFLLGSLVYWNFIILSAIISVITALFLTLKFQLHSFVGKISEEDIYATIKLAIITVIILPLLPDRTFGPFDVLNPRLIWYMVIFVSGISFIGYVLVKVIGQEKGVQLTGLLGGMVSSTAVAFSLSKKSKEDSALSRNFAVGIILASTVMYLRIFILTLVVNRTLVGALWLPMILFTVTGVAVRFFISHKQDKANKDKIEITNPFKLKSALIFGLMFGVILFATKAAENYLGSGGIYAASAIAGVTSVDAIVISLLNFEINDNIAVAAIIISTISNSLIKAGIGTVLGSPELKRLLWVGLGTIAAVSAAYLVFLLLQ